MTVNQTNSTQFAGTLSLAGSTNLTVTSSNNSTLTIAGAPIFTGNNMLNVNSGTLAFDVTSGSPTRGHGCHRRGRQRRHAPIGRQRLGPLGRRHLRRPSTTAAR